ncbi:DUF4142 domain-containing protein [Pontibacter liquoris]|uniref:DUF4142 domain-containing protein n=1 Tax=Pontibacter liquoris TaxID=2905677 RepID=UPI001FA709A9|nr:DUF4142 domain-containing protein [Pontibacter liquoris]
MKKTILISLLAAGSLLAGCTTDDPVRQAKEQSVQQLEAAGITNMENDALFAAEAASSNLLQIKLGQTALEKAVSPEVKALAEQLANDHRQMEDELETLGSQTHLVLPASLGKADKDVFDAINEKSGIAFDLAYIKAMEEQHDRLTQRYEDMAKNGVSMEVKQYAARQLPLLQMHLQKATKLEEVVDDAS